MTRSKSSSVTSVAPVPGPPVSHVGPFCFATARHEPLEPLRCERTEHRHRDAGHHLQLRCPDGAAVRFALGKTLRVRRRIATVDGGRLRRDVPLAQVTLHEFPLACARGAIATAPALPGHEDVSLS